MSTASPFPDRDRAGRHEDLDDVRAGWSLFFAAGALTILLGIGLIVSSFLLTRSALLVAGWVVLVAGAAQVAAAAAGRKWVGSVAALLNGVLYCGIAITLFVDRGAEVGGVPLAVAALVFTAGLCRLGLAIMKAYTHRELTMFNGAVGLVIGLMIGAAWYGGQPWAVGLLLGIEVIITGAAWVLFAVVLRRFREGDRPAPAP